MPTNRMHRGLVAVSASAVAAIYMAGYLRTQSADASIEAAAVATAAPPAVAAAAPLTATPAPAIIQNPAGASRSSSTPAPLAPRTSPTPQRAAPAPTSPAASGGGSVATAGYKDGTYTGQGSSRRGDVWVSVDVQGGKITQVTITRSTLQYPLRDIAGLPGQVVQRQNAQVDTVSRATYSSQAFRTAVAQALSRAA